MTNILNHRIRENNGELAESNRGWLYTILLNHCDGALQCYPSDTTLAKEVGVTRPTIQSAREWLIERGAIVRVPYEKWSESQKKSLHHKKIMYQITGIIFIKNEPKKENSTYKVLPTVYFANPEAIDSIVMMLDHIGYFDNLALDKESYCKAILQKAVLHEVIRVLKVTTDKDKNTASTDAGDFTKEQNQAQHEDSTDDPPTPTDTDPPDTPTPKDNAYELSKVIPDLLGLHNGREWQIAHMLSGTSKKKGYVEYTQYFTGDNMVTPADLKGMVAYYRKQHPDAHILQSPEIIADWIGKYRHAKAEHEKQKAILAQAPVNIPAPTYTTPIRPSIDDLFSALKEGA